MKTKTLVRPLKIKAVEDDGSFEGYGSVFDVVDSYRDIVLPGAFAQTIEEHNEKGEMPALLWQHNPSEPIGVWKSMEEDEHGLFMRGQLILDTQRGKEAHALLKAGAVKGLSIGFSLYPGGEKYNEDAKAWELTNINLWETSLATFPANALAQITDVRAMVESGNYPTIREFERFLRDAGGFSKSEAVSISKSGYSEFTRDADLSEPLSKLESIIEQLKD
jgi:hypothetical protein